VTRGRLWDEAEAARCVESEVTRGRLWGEAEAARCVESDVTRGRLWDEAEAARCVESEVTRGRLWDEADEAGRPEPSEGGGLGCCPCGGFPCPPRIAADIVLEGGAPHRGHGATARGAAGQGEEARERQSFAREVQHTPARGAESAQGRNRTSDTGIFSPLLYQLSYLGRTATFRKRGAFARDRTVRQALLDATAARRLTHARVTGPRRSERPRRERLALEALDPLGTAAVRYGRRARAGHSRLAAPREPLHGPRRPGDGPLAPVVAPRSTDARRPSGAEDRGAVDGSTLDGPVPSARHDPSAGQVTRRAPVERRARAQGASALRWPAMSRPPTVAAWLSLALLGCGPAGVDVPRWRLSGGPVTLPAKLQLDPRPQTVRLEADVEVPEPLREGALLELPVVHSLPVLMADGRATQVVDPGWTERWRTSGSRRFVLPAESLADGRVRLELTFAHRWAPSAWWDVAPRLLPVDAGPGQTAFVRAAGAFAFCTLLLLTFHVLNLLRVRFSAAAAWFALEAMAGVPYPAFMLGLLQGLDVLETALMGFGLCVSAVASVHFVRAHLGRPAPPAAWRWSLAVAFGAYVAAAFDPFRLVKAGAPVTVGLMLAAAVEQLVTFARAKGAPSRGVALIWPFANLCAVPDMVMWLGGGEVLGGLHPGVVGIGALVLAQSFVLSREHARSQRTTDELNLALAARVRELEQRQAEVQALNVELRHQLSERSRELERLAPKVASGQERALAPGDMVAERYRVERRIALGATGEVLEVRRQPDGLALAMKVLQRNEPEDTARLAREARLIASLSHPRLVSIIDVGMAGDSPFLVMPLAARSLRDERARFGDWRWATVMLAQVAEALVALHAAGVVHRDLKPGNVLVSDAGGYQVADLGAAAPAFDGAVEHLTSGQAVIGTTLYMAPETYDGARFVSVQADVFSFGVLAFEALTGQVPRLDGQPLGKALHRAPLARPPMFPAALGGLARVLDGTLAANPGARPTMQVLCAALLAAHRPA
jgi:hypothetical protein